MSGIKYIVVGLIADVYTQWHKREYLSTTIYQEHLPSSPDLPSLLIDLTKVAIRKGSKKFSNWQRDLRSQFWGVRLNTRHKVRSKPWRDQAGDGWAAYENERQGGEGGQGALVGGMRPLKVPIYRPRPECLDKNSTF